MRGKRAAGCAIARSANVLVCSDTTRCKLAHVTIAASRKRVIVSTLSLRGRSDSGSDIRECAIDEVADRHELDAGRAAHKHQLLGVEAHAIHCQCVARCGTFIA